MTRLASTGNLVPGGLVSRLFFDPARTTRLRYACSSCGVACKHVAGLLSIVLEQKLDLGLAGCPPDVTHGADEAKPTYEACFSFDVEIDDGAVTVPRREMLEQGVDLAAVAEEPERELRQRVPRGRPRRKLRRHARGVREAPTLGGRGARRASPCIPLVKAAALPTAMPLLLPRRSTRRRCRGRSIGRRSRRSAFAHAGRGRGVGGERLAGAGSSFDSRHDCDVGRAEERLPYAGQSRDGQELKNVEAELQDRAAAKRAGADTARGGVKVCKRPADLPGNSVVGLQHWWLVTTKKAAGMGPADGHVPGHRGIDLPGDPTKIVDHSHEAKNDCEEQMGVDEACIDRELKIGRDTGPWIPPFNDCHTVVKDILATCKQTALDNLLEAESAVRPRLNCGSDGALNRDGDRQQALLR
jgi:hypothetical protein